jgi:hypothetical protein
MDHWTRRRVGVAVACRDWGTAHRHGSSNIQESKNGTLVTGRIEKVTE